MSPVVQVYTGVHPGRAGIGSYTVNGLMPSTPYVVEVANCDASGSCGRYSSAVIATTNLH